MGNALLGYGNCFVCINGGQNNGAVQVGINEVRIKFGRIIQERVKQAGIKTTEVIYVYYLSFRVNELVADILQRPHIVPIGKQAIHSKREAFKARAAKAEIGIGKVRRQLGPFCLNETAQKKNRD